MRIIVFSDSHRNFSVLNQIVTAHPEADLFLHLGDGKREFEDLAALYPDKQMVGVDGNCDMGLPGKAVDVIVCRGKKIFFAHGHTFLVKHSTATFLAAARAAGAAIALHGHTHIAYSTYEDGLYIMNPGSVTSPSHGPASYGMIDITPAGIVLNIVPVDRGHTP